jgi:hypothetical protein
MSGVLDSLGKRAEPPVADLVLLGEVPFLESLSVDVARERVVGFEGIYSLARLKKLGIHSYPQLDLSRFPDLEQLFVTDGNGLVNLERLTRLSLARIWKLRADDLSFLAGMHELSELQLIQLRHERILGLDAAPALATLELSHCPKLASVGALPRQLSKLKIGSCPRLRDLSFLAGHPSLQFLYADVVSSFAFVPTLERLSYIGFEDVADGDLRPLFASRSLRKVGLPGKKHFFPPAAEVRKAFPMGKK